MKIKPIHKLSAIICGLTLLPLTVTAQNAIITTSTIETGTSYHDVSGYSALTVTGNGLANGVVYDGDNITLTGTFVSSSAQDALGTGAYVTDRATLTLSDGTITTTGRYGHGIFLNGTSVGTLNNVNIKTEGMLSHGVYVAGSSTLTLTDSDISATGENSNAFYLNSASTGTASLNKNTLTGNILATNTSTLNLTDSNGTVITGNVTSTRSSTIDITLSGSETKLIGTATHATDSAINLKIEDGTRLDQLNGNINTLTLQNGATLSSDDSNGALLLNGASIAVTTDLLTLSDDTILDYNDNALSLTGTLTIGNGILIDFSDATLETGEDYLILDWSNASVTGDITGAQFNIATTGVEGTFTVDTENKQLTFTATAVPEPSTWFLLGTGLGILLLTAHRCRNIQS
jgi:hypothetical protein